MTVEQMKDYWATENILVDDDELLVLRVLGGPDRYSYAIRLREAAVDLELTYETKDKNALPGYSVERMETQFIEMLRDLNEDMINEEGPGKSWKNRSDR